MLITAIESAVQDLVTVSSADRLHRMITVAVGIYNRYAPILAVGTIVTVVDQQVYTLPDDCLLVKEAIWYPGGEPSTLVSPNQLPVAARLSLDTAASRLIDEIDADSKELSQRGSWLYNAGELWLMPIPVTAGLTVEVYYHVAHTINQAGDGYDTIPDRHLNALAKLAASEALLQDAGKRANQFDYEDGLTRVVKGKMSGNLITMGNRIRHEAITEIQVP